MANIDLHTHSSASDGSDSPTALVNRASEAGLAAIALTDHDTLAGLDEAMEAAAAKGIQFIRGCEISTSSTQGEMHLLGLWIPPSSTTLGSFLETLRAGRDERNMLMIDNLRKLGLNISKEEIYARASTSVGRPHMAAALVEKGYASSIKDAFARFLGKGAPAWVPKSNADPVQAARLLNSLGATVIVAHPLLRPHPDEWLYAYAQTLAQNGMQAMEAWHSSHDKSASERIIKLAGKLNLGLSGGSDYHGAAKPDIQLGKATGGQTIPETVLDNLLAMRKRKGLPC